MLKDSRAMAGRPSLIATIALSALCFDARADVAPQVDAAIGATASAAHVGPLDRAAAGFKPYVVQHTAECLESLRLMRDRMATHDLSGAQQAWLEARSRWHASQLLASELYPRLEGSIDAWPDAGRGFHAVEAKLFGAHQTSPLAPAEALVQDVAELAGQVAKTSLTAQTLLNAAARLSYQLGDTLSDGGQTPFSGSSLAEMTGSLTTVSAVYRQVFEPILRRKDKALDRAIGSDLSEVQALLNVPDLRHLDEQRLREASERLTSHWIQVAMTTDLQSPALED